MISRCLTVGPYHETGKVESSKEAPRYLVYSKLCTEEWKACAIPASCTVKMFLRPSSALSKDRQCGKVQLPEAEQVVLCRETRPKREE